MSSLPRLALELLKEADKPARKSKAVVGFDGFVDTILHVVDKRESATRYTRISAMAQFGERITSAAGHSANFEFVKQLVKLGGNGPIMANALNALGLPITYIGNLGKPDIHPVFKDFASRVKVISIAEPGYTDAVEFNDGKLMFGKHASLGEIDWETLLEHIPEDKLIRLFSDSGFIAMVNWTMLPHMTALFRKFLSVVAPKLEGERRWVFFDLADPAKRSREDLLAAVKTIARFEKNFRVILGLNFAEGCQVGEVLGFAPPQPAMDDVAKHAAKIREKLGVNTVVMHPTTFAAAADANGTAAVAGPYTERPKITTGAGDHFNAGFCFGRISGGTLETSLQIGVATSGFYVRNAKSPTQNDLKKFLKAL